MVNFLDGETLFHRCHLDLASNVVTLDIPGEIP